MGEVISDVPTVGKRATIVYGPGMKLALAREYTSAGQAAFW